MALTKLSEASNIDSIRLQEQASAPSTPASGYGQLYAANDGTLHFKNDAGTDTDLTSGGGGASTALDNLASVAINTSLISDTDSTDDLGSTSVYWANSYIDTAYFTEQSAPSTPASGKVVVYPKADGLMYSKDDAGTETLMSSGAGGGAGITQLVTQHFDANGTGNFTSNSTSYVDVDGSLEFSITTTGGDLYVEYVALADKNTAGTATFRVVLDNGSDIVPSTDVTGAAEVLIRVPGAYSTAVAIRGKFTSLSAGTYTVKLQYKSSDANDARLYNNTHPVTAMAMEF